MYDCKEPFIDKYSAEFDRYSFRRQYMRGYYLVQWYCSVVGLVKKGTKGLKFCKVIFHYQLLYTFIILGVGRICLDFWLQRFMKQFKSNFLLFSGHTGGLRYGYNFWRLKSFHVNKKYYVVLLISLSFSLLLFSSLYLSL